MIEYIERPREYGSPRPLQVKGGRGEGFVQIRGRFGFDPSP